MKKGGFLRNVLDTIRSNQTNQGPGGSGGNLGGASVSVGGREFGGQLKPQHFSLAQVARHGFPEHPTALAFDPVQKIAAIGTRTGALRVFGRPGVDVWAQHRPEYAVTHIKFIINQGAIITVTSDDSIHLWSLRGPNLKLQLSANASSLPAQALSQSPASQGGGASSNLPSSSNISQPPSAATTSHSTGQNVDSGAQPGDPDYLADTGQPTGSPQSDPTKSSSRTPELLHTLKFQRERITYLHQTLMSKWLYIGTEKGNVHVANVETFELSGYSIAWNKAIELSRKTHPGSIIHISECPQDSNKLLIGYESGCIVLWDLKSRNAEGRYYQIENLLWLAWHYEGKQFVAAHGDGSLVTWQARSNARPTQILAPHAKTSAQQQQQQQQSNTATSMDTHQFQPQQDPTSLQSSSLSSSFTRALNNEFYRPINKIEWKTSRNNEQFLLFSGGLPYDGLESEMSAASSLRAQITAVDKSPSQQIGVRSALTATQSNQLSSQQLKASSTSPLNNLTSPSPISPSVSPSSFDSSRGSASIGPRQSSLLITNQQQQMRKALRSTSLTVMYGKSITVLEMDETIVDFITVCDNSPYENDVSDPLAVIVLLSNDLILIDLTSSGYPSFDSPYPANSLSESPVTCVQYLADCSSDLIPFLYSTSQNVVSRAPKKGFSDKEWPIDGGEWGQSMQSYPELVLTGHADGTIKFWDMSGVNFDLISKIRTSKLFERPNKLPNSIILTNGSQLYQQQVQQQQQQANSSSTFRRPTPVNLANKPVSPLPSASDFSSSSTLNQPMSDLDSSQNIDLLAGSEDNLFAIEKIEYCPITKHLLVAGALSQVIQFRLNKKESGSGSGGSEVSTILVEPTTSPLATRASEPTNQVHQKMRQHLLLKARSISGAAGSTSGGSSSSSSSHRSRASSFQPELICLTPLIVSNNTNSVSGSHESEGYGSTTTTTTTSSNNVAHYCLAPPKVTALAFQATHNILAYAHENGIVLVDIIQKCVIISATLGDLYGGGGASIMTNNRDISIQPFATSSILQHHYQATSGASLPLSSCNNPNIGEFGLVGQAKSNHNNSSNNSSADNEASFAQSKRALGEVDTQDNGASDNSALAAPLHKSAASAFESVSSQFANSVSSSMSGQQQQQHLRFSTAGANSMFQRQLSTTALGSGGQQKQQQQQQQQQQNQSSAATRPASGGPRMFQRQMTASQLFSSSSGATTGGMGQHRDALSGKQRAAALLASVRAGTGDNSNLAGSSSCLSSASGVTGTSSPGGQQPKKGPKNKRIISRMLSISAIHTSASSSSGADSSNNQLSSNALADSLWQSEHAASSTALTTGACDHVTDKIDSSFTRSRSSSGSSNAPNEQQQAGQQTAGESIQCLCFLDWTQATQAGLGATNSATQASSSSAGANNKSLGSIDNPPAGQLALWLGTSQGSVLLLSLAMPDSEDNRVLQLQSVNSEPIPQAAIKLPGAILCLAVFTSEASVVRTAPGAPSGATASPSSSLEGDPLTSGQQAPGVISSGQISSVMRTGHDSPASYSSFDSRTFFVVVSEKQARVYQIPVSPNSTPNKTSEHQHGKLADLTTQSLADSPMAKLLINKQNCVSQTDLSDSSFACRSGLIQMRSPDESCLASYVATGNMVVHSLPQLRLLLDADFVPYTSPRIASSLRFSRNGHCLYQPSLGEICKFTLSAQYRALVNEMTGALYVPRDMPEMPRANFFKSLFSVATSSSAASRQSERDELFGECGAGKASRGVAKHIGSGASSSASGFEKLKGAVAGSMGHDLRLAREGLDERGEKLGDLEDKTLQMMNQSETYAQAAHQLAQKFKDKKWYQF